MKHTPEGKLFTDLLLDVFKLNGLLIVEGDRLTHDLQLSSARWKVLGALAKASSALTVPEIAQNMGQTRQAVQRLANEMARDDLLFFKDNPHHKRAKLLSLTAKGKSTYKKTEEKQIPWANAVVESLTESELQQAVTTLEKLIEKLQT